MIVLDTHAWVWWLTKPEKLGKKAARSIENAERIGIPAICVWEIAMKVKSRKIRFDRNVEAWIDTALTDDCRIELLHLLPHIAMSSLGLSWEHADPADQFIVATARAHNAPLITADERIQESKLVRCIWE